MRTIVAEYNPQRNSIDVYTSAGYMLRIDCWEAEKNLKTDVYKRQSMALVKPMAPSSSLRSAMYPGLPTGKH